MPCHVPSSSTSRRRQVPRIRSAPPPSLLAVLDLSQPAERQAHDFLIRATSGCDRMWELKTARRHGDVLLCVVRWIHRRAAAMPFSVAEVSLSEDAVAWRYFANSKAARAEMVRRCTSPTMGEQAHRSPPR